MPSKRATKSRPPRCRRPGLRKAEESRSDEVTTGRKPARTRRGRPGDGADRAGVLVAVVGAEGRGKEMLVAIARRRFECDASLEFPARVTTRPMGGASGDVAVSRRAFRDLAAGGAFCCHWETAGQSYGLDVGVVRSLEAGRTVIVVVSRDAVDGLRSAWPDVRVVEVKAGPDAVSASWRSRATVGGEMEVSHQGDVAAAVTRFHDIIRRMRLERLTEARPLAVGDGGHPALAGLTRRAGGTAELRSGRQRA